MTLVDDSVLIMALIEKDEPRSGITSITSFQSNNRDLIRFTEQTYTLLTTFFMDLLKDLKVIKQIQKKR